MPKPILKKPQNQTHAGNFLGVVQPQQNKPKMQQTDKLKLDRYLRKKRSKAYMDALCGLDAGGHVHNQEKANAIIDAIRNEFPDIELQGVLLGIVSVCYLGKPYEVHTIDITGDIIEHFKIGQSLPNGLEKARTLALRGGYEFIEVYYDCCRCVSQNGTVSVVSC